MSEATGKILEVLARLARSKFRSRQKLREEEKTYLETKGLETVKQHAAEFIEKRLAPAQPSNDGKQTPWRGHPVFIAQHATATCCRSCLEKWHAIGIGRELSEQEREYVVVVITHWLSQQINLETGRNGCAATAGLSKPEKALELF